MSSRLWIAGAALALGACTADLPQPHPDNGAADTTVETLDPRTAGLIDAAIAPAVAGEQGWNFQRSAEVDLTGDGLPERVVLTARVELYRGRPAWDDGQPWQVYVEAPDGTRTYLYAQRLQLGALTMRVGLDESGEPAGIVLLEHLPDRLSLYEMRYRGPGDAAVTVPFQRTLDPRGELASPQLP